MRKNKPIKTEAYRKIVYAMALEDKARVVVEVGVYLGQLSRKFASLPGLERLTLVDSWAAPYMKYDQTHMNKIAASVKDWAAVEPHVTVLHMTSERATWEFDNESIDFWHTDGDHSHAGTYSDIFNWFPKVKQGSVMCGDNLEIPTVRTAINAAADDLGVEWHEAGKGRIWWFRKP